jgi:hypothetical protein
MVRICYVASQPGSLGKVEMHGPKSMTYEVQHCHEGRHLGLGK